MVFLISKYGRNGEGILSVGGRSRSRDPEEGPGSAVDTMPMSSMSLPWRMEFSGEGEILLGDLRERRFAVRRVESWVSIRGRLEEALRTTWEVRGLETWGEVGDDQSSTASHCCLGALEEGPAMGGSCWTVDSLGEESWQSSWSGFRLRWDWLARSSMGGKGGGHGLLIGI